MQVFNSIPPQAWIALALAITALAPASYVWQHWTHGLAPRDITLPPEDLEWKSDRQLYRCLAILVGLLGIGIFVFTPQAEAFARSDWFIPTIFGAVGTFALGTLLPGWREGEIEPLIRGVSQTYSKHEHPKRYWASMAWNAALGSGLMAASLGLIYDNATADSDDKTVSTLPYLPCIGAYPGLESNEAYLDRGLKLLNGGCFQASIADFTRLHERDPDNPYALANRGIAHAWLGEADRAERDFQRFDVDDEAWPVVLRGRAVLAFRREDFPETIRHLTQALEIDPNDYFSLRMRADAYWEIGEHDLARDDDDRTMAMDRTKDAADRP